ncbi:Nicotinate-nucleotide pyrophosphorylase [carboxylating] [Symmachiella macrocystis]|uniref:Probable nicotinate-nucleotide pyrophosphorylase [carboxylating] n=1 Tax=Symmachiella macrocystis TaxID=2527985 RepID=A0A5C6BSN4_9PLAN|nr:carboxylating nicotinate-nucleotide diphosphorylase [Symmachiella macrocystis]TWU13724.1 Nicotinate-nucleotide pyrophosphorylase [carboxylating] [Symmachiella macrocystis]
MNVPVFDDHARANARQLLEMALREDLEDAGDLTSRALIDEQQREHVSVVVREPGIVAGLPIVDMVFEQLGSDVDVRRLVEDGTAVEAGVTVAEIRGPLRTLLTGERTALNFLTHLSGIATLTHRYVAAATGTAAQILDTRKTLPGWRHLQKYAVRAGGGTNHRIGLYDGVLIKDNHLAGWAVSQQAQTIAAAIQTARASVKPGISIEVEVDTLEQLQDALDGPPDIVLLDNMSCDTLRRAVELRNQRQPSVQLEASGGVTLETVAQIAATGVERISIGALTHSAIALDLAFDWSGQ